MSFADVIKYEGDNSTFVWKHPRENFNTLSQLVVNESQMALLFKGGKALDLLPPGTHTMHTGNIPILGKLINLPFGGETPFQCSVYYINMTEQLALYWGVSEMKFVDKTFPGVPPYLFRANGQMNVRVEDPRKLIVKVVGSSKAFNHQDLDNFFTAPIEANMRQWLPTMLEKFEMSVFMLDRYVAEVSNLMRSVLSSAFDDYGFSLERLWVQNVSPVENDDYLRRHQQAIDSGMLDSEQVVAEKKARIASSVKVIEGAADIKLKMMDSDAAAYHLQKLGLSAQESQKYGILLAAASNESSGGAMMPMMGAGMGVSMGGAFGTALYQMANEVFNPPVKAAPPQTAPSDDPFINLPVIPDIPGIDPMPSAAPAPAPAPQPQSDTLQDILHKLEQLRAFGTPEEQIAQVRNKLMAEYLEGTK